MTKAELRDKVVDAFRSLRKHGIVARANFCCCSSCASYELAQMVKKTNKKGYVYWHRQDEQSFWKTGDLYLGFGSYVDGHDPAHIGRIVVEALEKQALTVLWNGESSRRIKVSGGV